MAHSGKHTKTFLAIDIGNSHTVIGLFKGESFVAEGRWTSTRRRTADETFGRLHEFLDNAGTDRRQIHGIGISSVVPELTPVYTSIAKKHFRRKPLIITAGLDFGICIHYEDPKLLGADRICNAVAGYAMFGGPLVIIDFGTATTYDVVASNGDFLGGVIAPGIETSSVSLHRRTAKLPRLTGKNLYLTGHVIGTNTVTSMQTGILLGAIDAMEGMVKRIQKDVLTSEARKATVIATGGFSPFVAAHSRVIQHVAPHLVLDGIRLIYNRVGR